MSPKSLRSPTLLAQTSHFFYLIDCWHHRVLFAPSLETPLKNWSALPTRFSFPHSLSSNNQVFLIDSTNHHQLLIFSAADNQLLETISLPSGHHSPHYLYYHSQQKLFYCLCARSQSLLTYHYQNHHLSLKNQYFLPFLSGHYCRSFYCDRNDFYFPLSADFFSSPSAPPVWEPSGAAIIHARLTNNQFQLVAEYPLPLPLANPNFLTRHQDFYYLTTTPSLFVRFGDFSSLINNRYQVLNDSLPIPSTPYYLSLINKKFYLPFIDQSSGVLSFSPETLESEFLFSTV
ncbi:hypothetical protein FWH30_00515 [Microgenomates group bacterium]|nr:hypothetical protein [Microgenomates group bacterium]